MYLRRLGGKVLLLDFLQDAPFTGLVTSIETHSTQAGTITASYRAFFRNSKLEGLSVVSKGNIGSLNIDARMGADIGVRDIIVKMLLTPIENLDINEGEEYNIMLDTQYRNVNQEEWETALRIARLLLHVLRSKTRP